MISADGRAELRPGGLTEHGMVLFLDGAEQSHVDPQDPEFLLYDYTLRMAAALELMLTSAAPRVLHLGAGALTLPRWVDHRWPEAQQTAVDIEPEPMGFALEHLPMERPPRQIVADAAGVLTEGGALTRARFDVVVVDLFNSAQAPASLTGPDFLAAVLRACPEGPVLMNLGDDPPMDFARGLVGSVAGQMQARWEHMVLSAPAEVIAAEAEGNLVLIAVPGVQAPDEDAVDALWARGPHPGEVLTGEQLRTWVQR